MRDFKIIGHRGACALEPENTLRSILRAIADGADMVEIDIRYASGEILVIHDETVDRTTNGHGSIHEMSFAEIRGLDAGMGERIPTLAEVIETTYGKCPLNIEIKEPAATGPLCDLLEKFGGSAADWFLVSSSHPDALAEARSRLPEIPIGIIDGRQTGTHDALFELAARLRAASIHPHLPLVNPELVGAARERNLKILPFTVRTRDQLLHLLKAGADGCFADDPLWARGVLQGEP